MLVLPFLVFCLLAIPFHSICSMFQSLLTTLDSFCSYVRLLDMIGEVPLSFFHCHSNQIRNNNLGEKLRDYLFWAWKRVKTVNEYWGQKMWQNNTITTMFGLGEKRADFPKVNLVWMRTSERKNKTKRKEKGKVKEERKKKF